MASIGVLTIPQYNATNPKYYQFESDVANYLLFLAFVESCLVSQGHAESN